MSLMTSPSSLKLWGSAWYRVRLAAFLRVKLLLSEGLYVDESFLSKKFLLFFRKFCVFVELPLCFWRLTISFWFFKYFSIVDEGFTDFLASPLSFVSSNRLEWSELEINEALKLLLRSGYFGITLVAFSSKRCHDAQPNESFFLTFRGRSSHSWQNIRWRLSSRRFVTW